MFKMTQLIYDQLKGESGLKVFVDETEHGSDAWLQFTVKNGGPYRIRFISNDDDNDVAVRVYKLFSVEENQVEKILPVINRLNSQYRFVKFVCDEDRDVNIEYDYPQTSSHPEESAEEIVIRIVRIIDEAYPELMRALWL